MRFTEKQIKQLHQQNKIAGYIIPGNKKNYSGNNQVIIPKEKSKGLIWLEWNLLYWANEHSLTLEREYKFDEYRKYRFDFCFPALKLAIEYNGIMSEKSRHTTITGYSNDMDKMNLAQSQGWKVLAYTPLNYTTVLKTLNELVK